MRRDLPESEAFPSSGVNMGGLGFLTEVRLENLYPSLDRVFANDFVLDERLMLRTHIHRHGETVAQGAGPERCRDQQGDARPHDRVENRDPGRVRDEFARRRIDRQHPDRIDGLLSVGRWPYY